MTWEGVEEDGHNFGIGHRLDTSSKLYMKCWRKIHGGMSTYVVLLAEVVKNNVTGLNPVVKIVCFTIGL